MARKHKATIDTPDGPRKCFEVIVERGGEKKALVARFGGIPLKRQRTAVMADREPLKPNHISTTELVKRLLADCCEICGSTSRIEVHHIRKLADLTQQGRAERPVWVKLMATRRRKTLVVCRPCHEDIHAGRATSSTRKDHWRAVCWETSPHRSGRGRRKRTRATGTSSAAYFTPPLAAGRHLGQDRHPAPGRGRCEGSDRLGCERRLHRLPGPPARRPGGGRRGPAEGAARRHRRRAGRPRSRTLPGAA
ncbi:hypothetical protein ABT063_51015 [Streptomyces sp. NPDC002838]|uniref:HNH endonuclease n=1 Tax=Streptomyces sp. NPDC002838 TaxID=3154436 RepID=UPI00331AD27D